MYYTYYYKRTFIIAPACVLGVCGVSVLRRGISGSIRREHWWANDGGGGNRHERAVESGPQNPVVVRRRRCGGGSVDGVLLERE